MSAPIAYSTTWWIQNGSLLVGSGIGGVRTCAPHGGGDSSAFGIDRTERDRGEAEASTQSAGRDDAPGAQSRGIVQHASGAAAQLHHAAHATHTAHATHAAAWGHR